LRKDLNCASTSGAIEPVDVVDVGVGVVDAVTGMVIVVVVELGIGAGLLRAPDCNDDGLPVAGLT